jgi:NADPH:quinone reductase-like Zn-dependent oxidoreductase
MEACGQDARRRLRAVVQSEYGSPELLALDDPAVKDVEVLVSVRAAGLHPGDCFAVRGVPFAMRLVSGLLKPKYGVPGFDLAGQVVAAGPAVMRFAPVEEVFSVCNGSCAEVACASEGTLALKPANLSWEQAAAVPTSALAALHALRDVGKVRPG